MRKAIQLALVLTLMLILVTVHATAQVSVTDIFPDVEDAIATSYLTNANGEMIGAVLITQIEEREDILGVWATVWLGLEPGFHAFHIHSVGTCDMATESPFTSAGGHFNPAGTDHGTHAGDLPSLYALADGSAGNVFMTDVFTLEDLLDEDGSAFMIHAGRDNYGNIPERFGGPDEATLAAGDAGPRVACGVIEPTG